MGTLKGTNNNDSLYGNIFSDTLEGGKGNDYLSGGRGNDRYIFNRGDGQDTILDVDTIAGNVDTIVFGENIDGNDLHFSRIGNNLKIAIADTTDSITILNYYTNWCKIEQIQFSDGTIWDQKIIDSQPMYLSGKGIINGTDVNELIEGSNEKDTITAKGGNDIIDGKGGGDFVSGGTGNDTYIFNLGYGILTILDEDSTEGNIDKIKFGNGISSDGIVFNKVGLNLEITIKGTTDKVIIVNYYLNANFRIEQINFFDGTIWSKTDINARPVYITGSGELYGTVGVDIFTGSTGEDKLYGYAGDDVLDGKGGNDYVNGGTGNDIYIFNPGDGVLTIEDFDETNGNIDSIHFGVGIDSENIVFGRIQDNLEITIKGSSDKIVIVDYYKDSFNTIEKFKFSNGVIWDKEKIKDQPVVIIGTGIIDGMDGNDIINGSDQDDVIYAYRGNDVLNGFGGNDQLYGQDGNDILDGGTGIDFLDGGDGSDTYIFNKGNGEDFIIDYDTLGGATDTIKFSTGISSEDVLFQRFGDDLVIIIKDTTDKLTVMNYFTDTAFQIERFIFDDGTLLYDNQVQIIIDGDGKVVSVITGTDNDDILKGTDKNDTFDGGKGTDILIGGKGNDIYIVNLGSGIKIIEDVDITEGNIDTIKFGTGILPENIIFVRVENNLEILIKGSTDKVIIKNYFEINVDINITNRIERIIFQNGVIWEQVTIDSQIIYLIGTDGNDTLTGTNKDDIFDGRLGNDIFIGGKGNDTYIINQGSGIKIIEDIDITVGNIDTIKFGAGILPGNIIFVRVENNLEIIIKDSTDKVIIKNYFVFDYDINIRNQIERIEFHGGVVWDQVIIASQVIYTMGTDGNDRLIGTDKDDVFNGRLGNDIFIGGKGNDTYIINLGSGIKIIEDVDITVGNIDTIRFGAGILPENIIFVRIENNLEIIIKGSTDKVIIKNYFEINFDINITNRIERIIFQNGVIWEQVTIDSQIIYLIGTDGNDTLTGTNKDDIFDGRLGNDIFIGGKGNDAYIINLGSGIKIIEDVDITIGNIDTIKFGTGILPENIIFVRVQNNLEIIISGSTDKVIIKNYFVIDYDINISNRIERIEFQGGVVWDQVIIASQVIYTMGTDGNDTLTGTDKDDVFNGRLGNDIFIGGKGNDTYIINLGSGIKIIEDIDITIGNIDTIKFGTGILPENIIFVRVENNLEIIINGSTDKVIIKNYFDINIDINISNRIEKIEFANGVVWDSVIISSQKIYILGTDGNDTLTGTNKDDIFDGRLGNDIFIGGKGNDTYIINLGSGIKIIEDIDITEGNIDTIKFGEGIIPGNIIFVRVENNLEIIIKDSTDKVIVKNYFVIDYDINISNKIERIEFQGGVVWDQVMIASQVIYTLGTDGNDTLTGTDKDDVFDGRLGNDIFVGKKGNDIYIINQGSGIKIIEDVDITEGNIDTIKFGAGILPENIIFVRIENNLEILINGSTDKVIIKDYFDINIDISISNRIEKIEFANGVVWDAVIISSQKIYILGTDGNDTLTGTNKDDIFDGRLGNDIFIGGKGNDTYIINQGSGIKIIEDIDITVGNIDTIKFGTGILPENIIFVRVDNNLEIIINGSADKVIIKNYFVIDYDINISNGIERIEFQGGVVWDQVIIASQVIYTLGTDGNDTLTGTDKADVFDGRLGNDIFVGKKGNDTYIINQGSGIKIIEDVDITEGNIDTIKFGTGILPENIIFVRIENNLEILINGSTDKVIIKNYFVIDYDINISNRIERIEFQGGVVWDQVIIASQVIYTLGTDGNDTLTGTDKADVFDGRLGNDIFVGKKGNDTYIINQGSGIKIIEDVDITEGNIDTIKFGTGILPGNIIFARVENNLEILIKGSTDKVIIKNYFVIDYDINISNKIERIEFQGGVVWDRAIIESQVIYTLGADGNDTLTGTDKADVFDGLLGDDIFVGKKGNDTYIINQGSGIKTIEDIDETVGNIDIIKFGAGILPENIIFVRVENNLEVTIKDSDDKVIIKDYFDSDSAVSSANKFERIEFSNGIVWDESTIANQSIYITGSDFLVGTMRKDLIIGSTGNEDIYALDGDDIITSLGGADVIYAGDGNDTLDGGAGKDDLNGGNGNDTYVFKRGYGQDNIYEGDDYGNSIDTILLGEGILKTDVSIEKVNDDLKISIANTTDVLTIVGYYSDMSYRVEKFKLADGTVWYLAGDGTVLNPVDEPIIYIHPPLEPELWSQQVSETSTISNYAATIEKSIEIIGELSDSGAASSSLTSGNADINTDLILITQ